MELREVDDLLQRLVEQRLREDAATDSLLVALAVRATGMHIANGLAMVAQSIGEIREEMLNQRLRNDP